MKLSKRNCVVNEYSLYSKMNIKSPERIKKAIEHYENSRIQYIKMAEKYYNNDEDYDIYMAEAHELEAKIEELKWVIGEIDN